MISVPPFPQEVIERTIVALSCEAEGYPRPKIKWIRNGKEVWQIIFYTPDEVDSYHN